MSISDKVGNNRSKFRRVYNYGLSRRPDIRQFVDSLTNTTKSFDFQKIIRDRDYYLINQNEVLTFPPADATEYLEVTTAQFTSAASVPITFPISFTATPFLAFEVSQSLFTEAEKDPNVAWWVTDLTTTGFTASFSAPFTGKITYRGVWTPFSYPVHVSRSTDAPGSFAWVSAGTSSVNYQSGVTMSWAALPTNPEIVNSNPVGLTGDTTLDIGQVVSGATTTSATNDLSIPFSGTIHFVALDTT